MDGIKCSCISNPITRIMLFSGVFNTDRDCAWWLKMCEYDNLILHRMETRQFKKAMKYIFCSKCTLLILECDYFGNSILLVLVVPLQR